MEKCLNSVKKMIYFIYKLTKIQIVVIFNFNMGNIGLNLNKYNRSYYEKDNPYFCYVAFISNNGFCPGYSKKPSL